MIALPGVILLIRALGGSTRLFHVNLIKIMQAHLIALAVSEMSRIVVVLLRNENNWKIRKLVRRSGVCDGGCTICFFELDSDDDSGDGHGTSLCLPFRL
ncbi:hypothetical protein OSTOST_05422 [Ostertagia ostertagi]